MVIAGAQPNHARGSGTLAVTPERFQQVEELFHAVREAAAGERAALLASCDPELRRDVESLLDEPISSDFMERPAVEAAPHLLEDSAAVGMLDGALLGPYRIEGKLGEGGMGQVFRAVDTRLGRSVAIKVIHDEFSSRFEREARVISSLNHPHICTLHDVGHNYLVMELVEGETLAARLKQGPLPIEMALRYAGQIAAALVEAHSKAIVHRDLKPGNIMIAKSGVKVLDFGLAKSGQHESLTGSHMVIGTPAYMSPEQAQGQSADARSDVFSFGCVLYEMLTGARIGLARKRLRSAKLERIVGRCLEEDPNRRWQSAAEVEAELARVTAAGGLRRLLTGAEDSVRSLPPPWLYAALAPVVAAIACGLYFYSMRKPYAPMASQAEWAPITDFADSVVSPALSPDGRMLTFIRGSNTFFGDGQIYIKLLPDGEPVQLTHDSLQKMSPKFSPDGSRIAYTAVPGPWDTWVVPVLGGEPRLMLSNAEGLTWIDPKNLLFAELKRGLHMVLVTTGINRENSRDIYAPPRERGMAHRSALSPDRKWVLMTEMDNGGWLPCRLAPFDGSSTGRTVGPADGGCTDVAWSPDGAWMYFSSDSGGHFHLWRQRFPIGTPQQLTSGATTEEGIAVAPDGRSLITSVGLAQSTIMLHDAQGERQLSSANYALNPQFSPDGKYIFYLVPPAGTSGHLFGSGELFRVNLETGENQHMLPGLSMSGYALFYDGKRIVFSSDGPKGHSRLWIADLDLGSPPRQFASNADEDNPEVDRNGNIYFRAAEGASNFLYRMKEDGSERVKAFPTSIITIHGLSPDGRWAVFGMASSTNLAASDMMAVPLGGGPPVLLSHEICDGMWGNQGKTFALLFRERGAGKTILFPVAVNGFPSLPPEGIKLTDRLEALGGGSLVDKLVIPGPNPGQYAYLLQSVHRNLYRIPLL
jgi:eukaryotic-like serine/threonine-protein kinase